MAGVVAVGVVTAEEVAREVARDEAIDLNPPTARELNLPFASPRRPESRRRPAGSKDAAVDEEGAAQHEVRIST